MRRAAIGVLALALAGCGSTSKPARSTPAPQATVPAAARTTPLTPEGRLTPKEREAIVRQRRSQRPRHSSAAVARTVRAQPPARRRAALLRALARDVLRDARARARAGKLEGPFIDSSCDVVRDDRVYARANPVAPVLRYECLAINFRGTTKPPTILGTPFLARVDFHALRYAWCLFTPVGGEGTHTATTLGAPPPAACAGDLHSKSGGS